MCACARVHSLGRRTCCLYRLDLGSRQCNQGRRISRWPGHKLLERGTGEQTHISSGSGAEPKHCCPSGQLLGDERTPLHNLLPYEAATEHGLLSAQMEENPAVNVGLVRGFKGFRGRLPSRAGPELIGFEFCRGEGGKYFSGGDEWGGTRPLCFVSPVKAEREGMF